MKSKRGIALLRLTALLLLSVSIPNFQPPATFAQGTAFMYQGMLNDGASPANGSYDLRFAIFDAGTNGNQAGTPLTNSAVAISNGLFTVTLDFGNQFPGAGRWLEAAVRTNGGEGFTTLWPRQPLTPTPYAVYAANAAVAASAGSMTASNLTGTISLAQLPGAVVTNSQSSLTLGSTNSIAPLTVPPRLPTSPLATLALLFEAERMVISGRLAYVASFSGGLQIVDVSNPTIPVRLGSVVTAASSLSVAVSGRHACLANEDGVLQIIDVSNPASPMIVGSIVAGSYLRSVAVSGRYACVADAGGNSLQMVDVSNPASPVLMGSATTDDSPFSVAVSGRYAYVANLLGLSLQIFDIGNPASPLKVGSVTMSGNPYSVAVSGRYAYVVNTDGNQLLIFDVSNPASPVNVGSVTTGSNPTDVAVSGRFAYVANNSVNRLQVFDVSNPATPVSVGSIVTAAGPSSVAVSGRYVYVGNFNSASLQTFDLGGAYLQHLEAGAVETGGLQVRDTARVGNNLEVRGGLTVGSSAQIFGSIGSPKWNATTVINAFGALPQTNNFTTGGGTLVISASGSGYASTSDTLIGMDISVDGVVIDSCVLTANPASVHLAFAPKTFVKTGLAAGSHQLVLSPRSGTITDNDSFCVTVMELPFP